MEERNFSWVETIEEPIGDIEREEFLEALSQIGEVTYVAIVDPQVTVIVKTDNAVARAQIWRGSSGCEWPAGMRKPSGSFPRRSDGSCQTPPSPDDRTRVKFWSADEYEDELGGRPSQHLSTSPWAAIVQNYPAATRPDLEKLMKRDGPANSGRLILWHGEPGSGKTHAIRALAHEWRNWCTLEYVTDPELFLGLGASYLLRTLNARGSGTQEHRLIVLEDWGN